MTTPTNAQAREHAYKLLMQAKAVLENPEDMKARLNFQRMTFNIDWTAAAILQLAKPKGPAE